MYVAVAALGGAAISAWSSSKSSSAASTGTKRSINAQYKMAEDERARADRMYYQDRLDRSPWLKAGQAAIGRMAEGIKPGGEFKAFEMSDYEADPGYEFRLAEGIKAQDRSAASRGQLLSGSQLKGLERYSQGMASQEYQNAFNRFNVSQGNVFNRLSAMSGSGQAAQQQGSVASQNMSAQMGALGQRTADAASNAALMQGQARASAYQGYGQAAGQALGAVGQVLNQQFAQPAAQAPPVSAAWAPLDSSNYY